MVVLSCCLFFSSGCMKAYLESLGDDTKEVTNRVFLVDPETIWGACLDALAGNQFETADHEKGLIQTKWKDDTSVKNADDSTSGIPLYVKAQFRFKISITPIILKKA